MEYLAPSQFIYKYEAVGNLTNIVYPVSTAITLQYDALNRPANMTDVAGTTVYGYANQFLASEDGPWANDKVSYGYQNGLRTSLTLLQPDASSWTQSYGFDAANRLSTLSSPAGAFTPTYKGAGNLVTNLALPNSAAITNAFDSVARLSGTWLKNGGGTILNSHKRVSSEWPLVKTSIIAGSAFPVTGAMRDFYELMTRLIQ